MDEILNKVGSYWFSKKASKEFNSVGDDINVNNTILNTLFLSISFFFGRFIFIFILLLFGKVPLFFLSFPFCFLIRVTEFYSSWLPAVMFVPVEKKISMELSSCLTMESWFWLRVRVEIETWLFIIHVNEHTRTCPFGILWKGKFFNGYFLFLGFFREECEKQYMKLILCVLKKVWVWNRRWKVY